jgi:HD-GYP domain-containing protein (c-di-GMP phosphodiesterase class II)
MRKNNFERVALMASGIKKISIKELRVGMFVTEMDISWLKSPFLLHRRAIKSENDIALLRQAGVRVVGIDLSKSQWQESPEASSKNAQQDEAASEAVQAQAQESKPEQSQSIPEPALNAHSLDHPSVPLEEELNRAVILKEQASESFKQLSEQVKTNQAIDKQELYPVIDDTISSLLRNSQAMLTLMHLKRYDEKLFSHSFSVMTLALTLGIKMELKETELQDLGMASLLHDIGWAQLPLNLFGKGKKYTDNELKVVYQHQKIASVIIGKSNSDNQDILKIMDNHHERLDGSGYPKGLKAEQIDTLSRILMLTDYYDENIHGLLDRPGLIPSETLRLMYKEAAQKKLDMTMVEHLIKLLGIYPIMSAVELSSGEKALVIEVNREKPLVPVVKIMYLSNGNALANPLVINLEQDEKNRKIKGVVDLNDFHNDPQNLLTA